MITFAEQSINYQHHQLFIILKIVIRHFRLQNKTIIPCWFSPVCWQAWEKKWTQKHYRSIREQLCSKIHVGIVKPMSIFVLETHSAYWTTRSLYLPLFPGLGMSCYYASLCAVVADGDLTWPLRRGLSANTRADMIPGMWYSNILLYDWCPSCLCQWSIR
jgi:hypothetical protein